MLEDLGHEVIEAREGQVAAELIRGSGRYDLLITDYAMPTQSGTDLIREVRSVRPDLPALIITGYADADAISDRPADVSVLSKPFDLNQLAGGIANAYPVPAAA
jgi:DNA-binding NtrC family response regulator